MKLKSYLISLLAICALFSCSKEDNTGIEVPGLEPDATLSLAVSADSQTKTKADNPADGIKQLTVLVYIGDAYSTMKDVSAENNGDLSEVTNIPVKSGNVKVLVLANAGTDVKTKFEGKSLTEALQVKTANLENEKDGSLTMSSGVMEVTLRASVVNCIGYTATPGEGKFSVKDDKVNLYRNVACIQLASLTVVKDTEYGSNASFVLKKTFVVNVKSESLLASEAEWGTVEADATATQESGRFTFWWQGGWEDQTGTVLTNGLLKKDLLSYEFTESERPEIPVGGSYTLTGDNAPIGKAFYVYENMKSRKGAQTIFVVCGDYTYTPEGATQPKTVSDTYYAVVVNDAAKSGKDKFDGIAKHDFVKRNVQYNLSLTLNGFGSDTPDPSTGVYVNSKVVVNEWNSPIYIGSDEGVE